MKATETLAAIGLLTLCCLPMSGKTNVRRKVVDEGGSGPYKAEAREEKTFPDAVIYKPVDLKAAVAAEGGLPVLVFANGGCNDTSLPHERMLTEVASRGYVVIALGSMQFSIDDRPLKKSPNSQMTDAMDWIAAQNLTRKSEYFGTIDTDKIAVAGQSCGGAQALYNAGDPRVKTCVMVNSGMGDFEMSDASAANLKHLHSPILYLEGGPSDVAYANGCKDYERIDNVFAAFANHLTAGHVGDFGDIYGGSFAKMLTAWLDWQLKENEEQGRIFTESRLEDYPGWTTKAKDPSGWKNEPFYVMEVHCTNDRGNNLYGKLYMPDNGQDRKPLAILAHGYNSSYHEVEAYAETLAQVGIAAYIFDFAGGAVTSRSEGKSIEMSVFTEADDIASVVKMVKSWPFIDAGRVSLAGCSQGGLVAAIASSQMPEEFKSVVLVYPAFSIAEHAVTVHPKEAITSETGFPVMGLPLSHVYYDKLIGYDVFSEMTKYKGDVMIVYGDKDPIAAGDYIERAQKAYRSCEVNVVPDGAHGFPESHTHVVANKHIVDFFLKTLCR